MSKIRIDELELWKDIPGWEGSYQVSTFGRVKSSTRGIIRSNGALQLVKERILCQGTYKSGHKYVSLCQGGYLYTITVHSLVLLAFVGPRPAGISIRHFPDRDPVNNRLSNLLYGTAKENGEDMIAHGTSPRGTKQGRSKLTNSDVLQIVAYLNKGVSAWSLGKQFKVDCATISCIRNGRTWGWLTGIKPAT